MSKQEEKQAVGRAIIHHTLFGACGVYDCKNFKDCIQCESFNYKITMNDETTSNYENSFIDYYDADEYEILFYDYVPEREELFDYLQDEDSDYEVNQIIRENFAGKKLKSYEGVVGQAKIERKMIDPCVYYDPFGLCRVSECLYCENCCYKITKENGQAISNVGRKFNSVKNEDDLNDDHAILFYDYVPYIDDLFSYIFDEDSRFRIVRLTDNIVMSDQTKIVKLVPVFKTKEQEQSFAKTSARHRGTTEKLTWDDEDKPKIYRKK